MKKLSKILCATAAAGTLLSVTSTTALAGEPYIGDIKWVGFNFCPRGWADADGQLLSISSNTALFSIYGTTYGGDGRTTFGLPDLRARTPVGEGNGPGLTSRRPGEKYGAETRNLTASNLTNHTHTATTTMALRAQDVNATDGKPGANVLANGGASRIYNGGPADVDLGETSATATTTISNAGGSGSVDVTQPSLVMKACVALTGLYPSRS